MLIYLLQGPKQLIKFKIIISSCRYYTRWEQGEPVYIPIKPHFLEISIEITFTYITLGHKTY